MKTNHASVNGLVLLAAALGLVISGCSSLPTSTPDLPPLIQHHRVEPAPEIDALAVTPDMQAFLDRYVLPYQNKRLRLDLLMLAVADKGVLGFYYNDQQTLTAAEAFRRRSGNCVSFANLFVALARQAGLKAHFQEVQQAPVWNSRGENLLVAKHINVVVETSHYAFIVDVSGQKISHEAPRRALSDAEALALYYNNLGAEALIDDDRSAAYAWFQRAIDTAPFMPDSWSNIGVLFSRNGQAGDAEAAYLHTLELDEREMPAMSNLHTLYTEEGRFDEAAQLQRRVERYRRENPYYLLYLSEEAVILGKLDEAEDLLHEAIRLNDAIHQVHYALARVKYLEGDLDAAQESLLRAQELAPREARLDYQHPLGELAHRDPFTKLR
jgi:tetratricopeptide (TPR) repeat protein